MTWLLVQVRWTLCPRLFQPQLGLPPNRAHRDTHIYASTTSTSLIWWEMFDSFPGRSFMNMRCSMECLNQCHVFLLYSFLRTVYFIAYYHSSTVKIVLRQEKTIDEIEGAFNVLDRTWNCLGRLCLQLEELMETKRKGPARNDSLRYNQAASNSMRLHPINSVETLTDIKSWLGRLPFDRNLISCELPS